MNYIKEFHEFKTDIHGKKYDYSHMKNLLNKILRVDFHSNIEVAKRTLEHYSAGDCMPKSDTVISALAKMCNVTSADMRFNLKNNLIKKEATA